MEDIPTIVRGPTWTAIRERLLVGPRVVDRVAWPGPLCLDELRFLKRHTRKPVKVTVVGPLTAACRVVDQYYGDEEALIMAMAAALNQELMALDAEGVDLLQI